MENFLISVIIVLALAIFVIFNCFYICSICDDIILLLDSNCTEDACILWEEKKNYISIFVRDAEIDVVDSEAKALQEETPNEDGEAASSAMKFREAVLEVKNSETPTFFNIF